MDTKTLLSLTRESVLHACPDLISVTVIPGGMVEPWLEIQTDDDRAYVFGNNDGPWTACVLSTIPPTASMTAYPDFELVNDVPVWIVRGSPPCLVNDPTPRQLTEYVLMTLHRTRD